MNDLVFRQPGASARDRRSDRRVHSTCAGNLVSRTGAVFNCTILDTSDGGARVCCAVRLPEDEHLFLLNLAARKVHRAVIVSKLGKEFGLRFLTSHKLGDLLPGDMQFLKRMWFESAR